MKRYFLLSKLHQVRVTSADLNYEGSFSIDEEILRAANIYVNEQINVYNIENGARFTTYAIPAPFGSKIFQGNGACAHHVKKGDRVIICTYGLLEAHEIANHHPKVLLFDQQNNFKHKPILIPQEEILL
jgi:aspartate 1-decarboxylase